VLAFSERSSPRRSTCCASWCPELQRHDVVIVVMPAERTAIHLDMIFTQWTGRCCIVYPPHFVGPERLASCTAGTLQGCERGAQLLRRDASGR